LKSIDDKKKRTDPHDLFLLIDRRKSVRNFKFADYITEDPIEAPASQTETVTGSQLSQDDAHASFAEKTEQSVPTRSDQCAISDVSDKGGYTSFV
jgi:hypothetical protein